MAGELTKVEIRAFKDNHYHEEVGRFELPINPEQLSQSFKVCYDKNQAIASSGTDPKFMFTRPEELTLNFTLDGTGVIPTKGKNTFHKDVSGQVDKFLNLVYVLNGESHKPNFLQLWWGSISFGFKQNCFRCILTDLTINYTLFAPDGKPLRAKLTATFLDYVEQVRRLREEGKKSPDVTHVRTVKAEDSLPLMTRQIYGDQSYYLQVAKANGLVNFRQLKTNTSLQFPPIDNTSP